MPEPLDIVAIGTITDVAKVRVVLYQDGRLVHAPFPESEAALRAVPQSDGMAEIEALGARLTALEARVAELENTS